MVSVDGFEKRIAEAWKYVVGHPLISVASVLLVIAVGLALFDRVAAGSLVGALFIVLSLFHFLPQMESFKAFGVEAKWRERIREADEILRKLRQSSLAWAKHTYHMFGWGSRMGGQTAKMKQALADQVDAALIDLGVEHSELMALKHDYLLFTAYDLFQAFDDIVKLNIDTNIQKMVNRLNELSNAQDSTEYTELVERRGRLDQARPPRLDLLKDLPFWAVLPCTDTGG
jgi:hypothetical protein